MLTGRLEKVIGKLIDKAQSGFLKGRFILDNVISGHEILHSCHTSQNGVALKIDFEKAFDGGGWMYMLDILKRRGFGTKWVDWIRHLFASSSICINFNGTPTAYFPCKRGLRQVDLLSPFLFDFAADTLCKIFQRGAQSGLIRGLGPIRNGHFITNIHYADDTIVFLEATNTNVERVYWSMLAFGAASGIKINFSNTELIPINISSELSTQWSLPLTYLGIPLHYKKLQSSDWSFVLDKIHQRLQTWKGNLLSLGGRITLFNAVISAIPLYAISIFKMPEKVRKLVDKTRCRFLSQGNTGQRKKYALVSWKEICLLKMDDGMGVLDLTNYEQSTSFEMVVKIP